MGKVKAYYKELSEQEESYVGGMTGYYVKILMVLKKCNLQDLRTIYETLVEMGFRSEK
jgi:hypothetical protein